MSRSYGVLPTTDNAQEVDPNVEGQPATDTAPLLGNGKHAHDDPQGPATLLSSIANLDNTIIGSGMLTFPLAMASSGLLPGILTCLFCGFVAALGLFLLSRCAAQVKPPRTTSFFSVAMLTFPSASVFFDLAIAIKCFGVSISYLIIIKGLMPAATKALYHALRLGALPSLLYNGRFWLLLFAGLLVPLCFLRRLDSLRHTSYIALFSVAYLVSVVIISYFRPPDGIVEPGEIRLVHFTRDFVSTFPVQVFAFTCAQNIFPIFNELRSNTQARMNITIGTAIGGATVVYEIIAIFGYLTFGNKVGANIIAMYPETSLFIAIGQIAIVVLVLFSYPLQVLPCRNSLDKVVGGVKVFMHQVQSPDGPADGDDEVQGMAHDSHAPSDMSSMEHIVLTCAIVISGFTIAFFVDDLQLVLSFVGSTGSTTISFILPGLFYFKLFRKEPESRVLTWAALALAIYGIAIMVFCLSYNIYKVAATS